MKVDEFIDKYMEEFKKVEGFYEKPSERELVLMFIGMSIVARYQVDDLESVLKYMRYRGERLR